MVGCQSLSVCAASPGELRLVPSRSVSVTPSGQPMNLDCGVHDLTSEVIVVVETLSASPQQAAQELNPVVLPAPRSDWAIALSIGINADARRIRQALTEPEYLEAWIAMPDKAEDSSIVASKTANGYGLDHWRAGHIITRIIASFLFCHQRKMRLSWCYLSGPNSANSLVDFRIRGNFGSSVLELRQTAFVSAGDYLWHQALWQHSLETLAQILRST